MTLRAQMMSGSGTHPEASSARLSPRTHGPWPPATLAWLPRNTDSSGNSRLTGALGGPIFWW